MKIKINKFGVMLVSRPAGKEAYLAAKAYIFPKIKEKIELDFSDVAVLSPSWADEFITKLKQEYPKISFTHLDNDSIKSTLEILKLI